MGCDIFATNDPLNVFRFIVLKFPINFIGPVVVRALGERTGGRTSSNWRLPIV